MKARCQRGVDVAEKECAGQRQPFRLAWRMMHT
jgi:hypothetical protein